MDGTGWLLIDEPWFKTLEAMKSRWNVRVPIPPKISYLVRESDYAPTIIDIEMFEWERGFWHPGGSNPFSPMNPKWLRWQEILGSRTRPGWRVKPDGKLPTTFCTLTLEQAQRSDWYL